MDTQYIIEQLSMLSDAQVAELNAALTYDTVEIVSGPGGEGADVQGLAEALNKVLYLEDQETLYAEVSDSIGDTVEINDKPNATRVKRPNGGGN